MKNIKSILSIITLTALLLMFLNSCDKKCADCDELDKQTDGPAYVELLNVFNLRDVEYIEDITDKSTKHGCLSVTIIENPNGELFPINKILDYGDEGCTDWHGNVRKGKIFISFSDYWMNDSSLRTITFEDYSFNDNMLEGTKTILNNGTNENGNPAFTRQVIDGVYTKADSSSMTWNCIRYSEMIEGSSTFYCYDNVWSVTGSSEGVNYDNENFTVNITTALIYKHHCYFPVSGVIEIITNGTDVVTIDYGDGDCDSIIIVTINGESEEISLV